MGIFILECEWVFSFSVGTNVLMMLPLCTRNRRIKQIWWNEKDSCLETAQNNTQTLVATLKKFGAESSQLKDSHDISCCRTSVAVLDEQATMPFNKITVYPLNKMKDKKEPKDCTAKVKDTVKVCKSFFFHPLVLLIVTVSLRS